MVYQNTSVVCRLQRVQNTAARIVTLTRKYDSITPIMFKLHWLPVHSRIIFKLLLLVYKALNGKAPSYISSLLSHRKWSRSLRSSGQELFTVPLAKLKTYGDRAFSTTAPRQWNNLPLSIPKSSSIAIFTRHLQSYLQRSLWFLTFIFNTRFFISFIICNFILVFLDLRFLTFIFCMMYI